MVVVCCICRDTVHSASGYILKHGTRYHGVFQPCAGSGSPVVDTSGCCSI